MPMASFNEILEKNMATLKQNVPIVARVHGGHHPEFIEVARIFDTLAAKIDGGRDSLPDLAPEFEALRRITSNYAVPADTCETYEAVYTMLQALDGAYGA